MQFLREKTNSLLQKLPLLEIIVFINGAIVMIVELLASRILAPYFGTSTITWTAIIAVLLGALSLGYWFGGKLSSTIEPSKTKETLGLVFLLAAASLFVSTLFNNGILEIVRMISSDIRLNSVIGALLLYGVPITLMGIVSPFAVSIGVHQLTDKESGPFIGRMYSVGTIGSILGTFLGGFLLITIFGTTTLLYLCSGALVLMGIILVALPMKVPALVGVILCLMLPALLGVLMPASFADIDTLYGRIWVVDGKRDDKKIRVMQINAEFSSAVYPEDPTSPVFNYTKTTYLTDVFFKDPKRILVLGGGAMTMPAHLSKLYPQAIVDVVEIDGQLEDIAKKYFYYEKTPNITLYAEDARTFINNYKGELYDVIFIDVYRSLYMIPFHVITREAMQKVSDLAVDDGIIITNVISTEDVDGKEYLGSILKTMGKNFPHAYIIPIEDLTPEKPNNIIIVAGKRELEIKNASYYPEAERFLAKVKTLEIPESSIVFTDDFAPVEKFTTKMLSRQNK
jgi:spermidine synthase